MNRHPRYEPAESTVVQVLDAVLMLLFIAAMWALLYCLTPQPPGLALAGERQANQSRRGEAIMPGNQVIASQNFNYRSM